jgi:hypothetical protein
MLDNDYQMGGFSNEVAEGVARQCNWDLETV